LIAIDVRLVHHSVGILSQADREAVATSIERLGLDVASKLRG
jgi:hypothetical protein